MKINVDLIYPVGSIYFTTNTINPEILFGGVWEQYAKGKCIVGIDTDDDDFSVIGKTGGEKIHTLTIDEMPVHEHKAYQSGGSAWTFTTSWSQNGGKNSWSPMAGNQVTPTGGGKAHNNLSPYIVTYIWRRIS